MNYLANYLFEVSGDRYSSLFAERDDIFELEIINCYCQINFNDLKYAYKSVSDDQNP